MTQRRVDVQSRSNLIVRLSVQVRRGDQEALRDDLFHIFDLL